MNARDALILDRRPLDRTASTARGAAWPDRFARERLSRVFARLTWGELRIVDADGERVFGKPAEDAPRATVRMHAPRAWREMLFGGSLGAAEAYMDGAWSADDLPALFRIFARNAGVFDDMERDLAAIGAAAARLWHAARRNTRAGSRRNIAAHYDLGNDFFELFLDDTLSYSAGIFEWPTSTMREASIAKIDRLCRKLDLRPDDHLIEIGTGWGAFAIHAAANYGCRVTTTTISARQLAGARERIRAAGLDERIELRSVDWRDLDGTYDKLVSVEMIEAVGHRQVPAFLAKCAALLTPTGRMALQAITVAEQRYAAHVRTADFIKRYVFPGSDLTSLAALADAVARRTDFSVVHVEDLTAHYAETLRRWRAKFHANADAIRALGYPERFVRLWDYYLAYCEGGFAERYIGDVQVVLAKPLDRTAPILAPLAR